MVCVRLRLGLLQQHLGDLFCVSTMTVSRVMSTWINFMYDHMKDSDPTGHRWSNHMETKDGNML
ncbi:hypothetical protein MAR_018536, partial [Mya arenaria]